MNIYVCTVYAIHFLKYHTLKVNLLSKFKTGFTFYFLLETLEKEIFCHSLCKFIPEVTRQRNVGPYPGRTLHQMIVAIQKFLNVNKIDVIMWKLIDGKCNDFIDVYMVLDNV